MSLELALKALVQEVVTEVIGNLPKPTKKNAASADSTPAPVEAKKQPASASVTMKQFTDAFLAMMNEKGRAAAQRVLAKYKAERASLVKEADLPAALADVLREHQGEDSPKSTETSLV